MTTTLKPSGLKSIFEYDNYRSFLSDYYVHAKATNSKFSFRYFSRLAGFKSGSVLKQVIDGQTNIASNSVEKFAKALKLNKRESAFFFHLVHLNQASTSDERAVHAAILMNFQSYRKTHPLVGAQLNYLKHWYLVPIRELVSLKGFKEDPEWIARQLHPRITTSEARKALDELLSLGLVVRDVSGVLIQSHENASTGDEVISAFAAQWHREMLIKASESIGRDKREIRDVSSVTVGVSKESVATIKQMVQAFRKEIMLVAARDTSPDRVYQMNFQFFPVTDPTVNESEPPGEEET